MPTQQNRSLSLSSTPRIPKTVLSQELAGETVLLHLDSSTYYGLDGLGTHIWRLLQAGTSPHMICRILCEEYDVDERQLSHDLLRFLQQLAEHGLIDDAGSNAQEAQTPHASRVAHPV